ncbi:MAG: GNAT family N-acetyltransferase [Deltaproteobacteria bacterium]|nr:GNAT family N-acetyltransferase [Deltaproteobacteria bacterium]
MIDDYPKQIILKDGQEVVLRLLRQSDFEPLIDFFRRIPDEERWYNKHDLTDPELIRTWVESVDLERVIPVVAEAEGRLVAQATLHRHRFGCLKHVGRIRILVDSEFRGRRLGTWILLDLINLGVSLGLERLEARFAVGPEDAAIQGARRLDFFEVATLPRYVKSKDGHYQDLKIMIKRLHPGWDDF